MTTLALVWQPYFSPTAIAVGAVAMGLLTLWAGYRAYRVRPVVSVVAAMLRLLAIVVIALLLLGPSMLPESAMRQERSTLKVMIDTSRSMRTEDTPDGSRFAFARKHWLSDALIEDIRRHHQVDLITFDREARPLGMTSVAGSADDWATGESTHVADSVRQVIGDSDAERTAGVLLISDGRDTENQPVDAVAALARARSIPVHVVPLGGPRLMRDVMVSARPKQDYLLAGETGAITIRAIQIRAPRGESTVRVTGPGQQHTRQISFDGNETVSFDLPVKQDEPGVYEYVVSIDAIDGELETRNNKVSVFMEVAAGRFKVLVLEGQPFWDTKFIAQSLRKDDRIELTQITQVTNTRRQTVVTRAEQDTAELPQTAEQFAAYDVVIIGGELEHLLTAEETEQLVKFVADHGGQVIFARGRAYDPGTPSGRAVSRNLAVIEPVVWGRGVLRKQTLDLEPAGRSHPSFSVATAEHPLDQIVHALPALDSAPAVQRSKTAARVLARLREPGAAAGAGEGQPALLAMPYGRGMVVAVVGEGLWKWNLSARRDERLVGVYDRFWSNMVRWMALGSGFQPDSDLALKLSSRVVRVSEPLNIDLIHRFRYDLDAGYRIVVTDPDAQATELEPTVSGNTAIRASVEFVAEKPGVHEVAVRGPDGLIDRLGTRFQAYEMDLERLRCAADPLSLRQLATLSGGQVLDPQRPEQLLDALDRQRAAAAAPPQPTYIWDRGMILIVLIGALGLEWIGRKKGGLL